MKEVFAVLLLLTAVEGGLFWNNFHNDKWKGPFQPPGQSFQPPGQSFQPPGQSFQPPGQSFQPPGQSFQPPGHSFQPPGPPFPLPGLGLGLGRHKNWRLQQQQDAIDISNAEWICQNPRTRDMMIIAAIDGAQTVINGQTLPPGTWPSSNSNENSQDQKPNMNSNNGNGNNMNPATTAPLPGKPTPNTNTDESALQNAGAGLIDIRMAAN